ncbi:MAG TPA: hypothetical protein VGB77_09580 [Abditibacteriaceae bacterium]
MCWACYTSLTGGGVGAAALAGAGAPMGAATPMADSDEKKKIDPKHLAIIGIGLLIAAGFGVSTMMGSGEGESDPLPFGGDTVKPDKPAGDPPPAVQAAAPSGANPVGPSAPTPGELGVAQKTPYQLVAAPNLRYSAATVAIVPTQNNVSPAEAKALATVAQQQILQKKKFAPVEIFVFNDEKSAQTLAAYQRRRRGAPLTASDYSSPDLAPAWKSVIIRHRNDGKRTAYTFPNLQPGSFWSNDSRQ